MYVVSIVSVLITVEFIHFFGIITIRSFTSKEKISIIKSFTYSIFLGVIAVLFLGFIVVLF